MARDFRKIRAWQLADDLTVAVYSATKRFPQEETYGVTSQVRRAATSVPANIVEGANRATKKDYAHFLNIARGSLAEAEYESLDEPRKNTGSTLNGLIKAVQAESRIGAGDTDWS